MAEDRAFPEDSTNPSQDFQLLQALEEGRRLAAANDDEDAPQGWRELHGRLDRVIERIGADGPEPAGRPAQGRDRLDRSSFSLDPDTADRAVGSLMALADRPDEDQLELANRAVRDLEDALR